MFTEMFRLLDLGPGNNLENNMVLDLVVAWMNTY